MWARGLSFIADDIEKGYSNFRREFGGFLYHKTCSYHTVSNPSPMYLPKRIKNLCLHKCLHTYRAVLLIAQTWKQSKCPSVGEKTALWPDN